jgi:hypothetical protein
LLGHGREREATIRVGCKDAELERVSEPHWIRGEFGQDMLLEIGDGIERGY